MKELSGNSGSSEGFDNRRLNGSFDKQQIMNSKQEFSGEVAGKKENPQKFFDEATHVFPRKEKAEPLPQPEKYRFVGPNVLDPEKLKRAKEGFSTENMFKFPNELEKSEERKTQLKAMTEVIAQFGEKELGIDLSKRLPRVEKFHFYEKNDYAKVNKENGSTLSNTQEETTVTGEITIEEQKDIADTLGFANHGLVHAVGSSIVVSSGEINNIQNQLRNYNGYMTPNRSFLMLNETLTEITNLELRGPHWAGHDDLKSINFGNQFGYIPSIIVMDELVGKVANEHDKEYKEVLRHLQKGMILGQRENLGIIKDAVGTDGMKALAKWKVDGKEEALGVAKSLGLNMAQKKVEKFFNHDKVLLLGGLENFFLVIEN